MNIYHYNSLTGEFCGQSAADLDPLDGLPLIPAHATSIKPPTKKAGFARVFRDSAWSQQADHRGMVYDINTGQGKDWRDLGPLPVNLTKLKPPSSDYSWNGTAWSLDSVKAWSRVRRERDELLAASDWTQLPDAALTAAQKAAWAAYRQALRDITTQADPLNITWPAKPA